MSIEATLMEKCGKDIQLCNTKELYNALAELAEELAEERTFSEKGKKLYYISAEFLVGKLLINNLINLGIYDEVKAVLKENGKSLSDIEEYEREPSLGNGGLGRLAACFMDSVATLGLNGEGIGLNYHFGLFRQRFENNMQKELPDKWQKECSQLKKTDKSYKIRLGNKIVTSRMYDMAVTGYESCTKNYTFLILRAFRRIW